MIQTLPEISAGLQTSFVNVQQAIEQSTDVYRLKPTEKWSIEEQFDHLIRSNIPVCKALFLPEGQLAAMGQPEQPSRDFDSLYTIYSDRLATGAKATGRFIPKAEELKASAQALREWQQIGGDFQLALAKWEEDRMDRYVLPHPVLGNLTIREMLFFTIFHNEHHLNKINALIDGTGSTN